MTLKQVLTVKDNLLIVKLPPRFTPGKRVVVTVEDEQKVNRKQKLALLKKSTNDPLFQSDIQEVANDFDPIDDESI
ncbi:hypothetical protein [Parapedobacter sp. 10938]|uniref:hypothetical protein n=1 Tax=Parapedobacter flavus TaxID=3110225 RepID=UPI002DBE4AC2|nr:hypothetical protein [Parapedobacter sp. 10938]MEC3878929.1 hypothetical protein [Parapedobacter sp. 10938]